MTNENTIKKFLPCLVQDTETLSEWLDALSIQGYLLRDYSINFLYAEFIQSNTKERYFHLVIPTMEIKTRGIVNNEEMDQSTISEYKEKGMEYVSTTCGYMIFRTKELNTIKSTIDINGYLTKRNAFDLNIIQFILSIVSAILLVTHIHKLCINNLLTGFFIIVLILVGIDIIFQLITVIKKVKELKQEDSILPLYMKEPRMISSLPQVLFIGTLFLLLIFVVIILIMTQQR